MSDRLEGTAVYFTETQRFRQLVWLRLLAAVTTLPLIAFFGALLVGHFAFNKTWAGMSDGGLLGVSALAIGLPLAVWALMYFIGLITEVTPEGVRVRFHPVHSRTIPFGEIESQEAVKYNPLSEYGGWGIRWSRRNGMAYNVSGNRGVRLKLTDGRTVLIGSADAERLSTSIRERMGG